MTNSFVEDSFAISPKDILQNRYSGRTDISYWSEDDSADPSAVFVSMTGKEPQELVLEWNDITYGKRPYFICSCGHRSAKLYLPIHSHEFKCRECHQLQYQLSSFNRNSVGGKSLYKFNRLQKLSNSRADMARILYNGNYSKRFQRFLRLCDKAGLNDVVRGADSLKALLQG